MSSIFLPWRLFAKSHAVRAALAVMVLANSAAWLLLAFQIKGDRTSLNLHYTVLLGIDWIGAPYQAYIFPLAGLIAGVVNYMLGWAMAKKLPMLGLLLLLAGAGMNALLLAQTIIVIMLNT